jgi:hypothetical protein
MSFGFDRKKMIRLLESIEDDFFYLTSRDIRIEGPSGNLHKLDIVTAKATYEVLPECEMLDNSMPFKVLVTTVWDGK